MDKEYLISIGANKKSIENLKSTLTKELNDTFDKIEAGGKFKGLDRSDKATIKKDLSELFGIADEQADALRKMVQGIIPTDTKGIEAMKSELRDTLDIATQFMKRMKETGDAADWMSQGVGFANQFDKMQAKLEEIDGVTGKLQRSIVNITKTFNIFRDALAETNADTFLQRFGNSTKSEAEEYAKAAKEIERLGRARSKAVKEAALSGKAKMPDFSGMNDEDIELEYKDTIQNIIKYNNKIEQLTSQYKSRTEDLHKDKEYITTVKQLAESLNYINKMPSGVTSSIGASLTASLQDATDSVKDARREINQLVEDLKTKGIEIAITLPDASTDAFAKEIGKFVKKAEDTFKDHPIEVALNITSPFTKDAFDAKGKRKELTQLQKKLSDETAAEVKKIAEQANVEITDDDLNALYSRNSNKIARNSLDAFTNLYKTLTKGQALLSSATKDWRSKLEESLTIKPKFDLSETKQSLYSEMSTLQTELEGPEMALDLYADTDALINSIQKALNAKVFDVNVEAGGINGGNIVIQAEGVKLSPSDLIYKSNSDESAKSIPIKIEQQIASQSKTDTPYTQQTDAVNKNVNAITNATRTQVVLTSAINELNASIQSNKDRDTMAQNSIQKMQEEAQANAEEIAKYQENATKQQERVNKLSAQREELKIKRNEYTQKQENLEQRSSDLSKKLYDLLKAGDIEQFNIEFHKIVDKLPQVREDIEKEIKRVEQSNYSEDRKRELLDKYNADINLIDNINQLSPQDVTKSGKKVYFAAIDAIFDHSVGNIKDLITGLDKEIDSITTQIMNANTSIGSSNQRIKDLSYSTQIEERTKNTDKRSDTTELLQSRLDKINAVLQGNQDPVTLIFNEVQEFWKTCEYKINKAQRIIDQKEKAAGLDKLDKNSKEYREKRSELAKTDKQYLAKQNELNKWKQYKAEMLVTGLDQDSSLDDLREVLTTNSLLADSLGQNKSLKGLKNIKELLYFIPEVQKTLGVTPRTETEYLSDQELRNNFKEALKVNQYIKMARELLSGEGMDIDPSNIQQFIDYFGHIPGMADAVDAAVKYLDSVKELPQEMWSSDERKTYKEQMKDIWGSMDEKSKSNALAALNGINAFGNAKVTQIDKDNWDLVYDKILMAYNESNSELKALQTDNPQLQQILGVLERSALLNNTRDAANAYGEHGILSALFGIQRSKVVGNFSLPKDPINLTAYDDRNGKKKVYHLGAGTSNTATDGRFSYKPESFDALFRKAGVTEEINGIIDALFNHILVASDKLESEIRGLQSELSVLESFNRFGSDNPEENRKKLKGLSYRVFDGTELEADWHKKKNVESEILALQDILRANLDVAKFPDELWKEIKGLRKQKRLEKDIANLKNGNYSDQVKSLLKGLDDKETKKKVQEIIADKTTELNDVKTQNKSKLQAVLTAKLSQLTSLEDQIIAKTQEVVAAKQQELSAKQKELKDIKPLKAAANQIVDNLIQSLLTSGKIELSHGKTSDKSPWAGEYKYDKSELAKYEKQKVENDKEIKRLESEIKSVEAGNHDDEIKKSLLRSKLSEAQIDFDEKEIANLQSGDIDKYLVDKGVVKDDSEIKSIIAAKREEIIAKYQTTIAELSKLAISKEDVIQGLLDLQHDIDLSDEKADHAKDVGKSHLTKTQSLNGNKKFDIYGREKERQKSAIYREANRVDKNILEAKDGPSAARGHVAKVNNLLKRIQLAKTYGLMDTTELEKLAEEYEQSIQEFNDTKDLKASGKATDVSLEKAKNKMKDARKALVDKFFNTDGWFKTQQLEEAFAKIDGELEREIQSERNNASVKNQAVNSQMDAINEKKQADQSLVDNYVESLRDRYLVKPREDIRNALLREVDAIQANIQNQDDAIADVSRRANSDRDLAQELARLTHERDKSEEYQRLKEQQRKLRISGAWLDSNKKQTQEYKDLSSAIDEIEKTYIDAFDKIKEKWISDEINKIKKSAISNSAYSQNAKDIAEAKNIRDSDLENLRRKARENNDVIAEKNKIKAEMAADKKYAALLKQYEEMTRQGTEKTDEGKLVYDKLKTIKSKYDQKMANAETKWVNAETKRINDTYDAFVNTIVENSFDSNKASSDYMTALGEKKKAIIDRLISENAEFANLVDTVKNEKGEKALSTRGKTDYHKLAKELIKRGIPDDMLSINEMMVLSDAGVRKSDDITKHLQTLQSSLNKKIKQIIDKAIQQIDNSDIVPDEQLAAEIERKQKEAEKKRQDELTKVQKKTDRELLADRHTQAVIQQAEDVTRHETDKQTKKTLKQRLMSDHGVTDDILKAAQEGTLIYQQVAQESKQTAAAIEDNNKSASEIRKSTSQMLQVDRHTGQFILPGGLLGSIDTSDLAKEGTLRGIYEVLNGGAPKGGWDDSVSESSKVHENQGGSSGVLSDNNIINKNQLFAESISTLMESAADLPHEIISLLGNKKVWSQTTSGERGIITMDDVYGAFKRESHVLKASMHNHPNGIGMMSKDDVKNFLKLAYDESIPEKQRVKVHGAYSDTDLSSLNFTGITKEVAETIINTTFDEFNKEVAKQGLTYNETEQKYYRGNSALDPKNKDDIGIINNLEKYFYKRLSDNFENFGFDKEFQFVEIDDVGNWTDTIMESAKSILERAKQNVISGIDKVNVQVSDADVSTTTSQIADNIVENAVQSAKKIADVNEETTQTTKLSDLNSIYQDILGKFGFEKIAENKLKQIRDLCIQYSAGEDFEDLFRITDNGDIEAASDEMYKIPEMRAKIIDAILESLESTLEISGQLKIFDDAGKENIGKYLDSILPNAIGKIAETVVEAGVQEAIESTKDEKSKKTKKNKNKKNQKDDVVESESARSISASDDKSAQIAQEQAAAETKTAQAMQEQAQASGEVAKNKAKSADEARSQAQSESKTADSIADQTLGSSVSSSVIKVPESGNNQGGILGILNNLAKESTLSSIASTLSAGITVKDGGKGGDKKSDKDKTPILSADAALKAAQDHIRANYPQFSSVGNLKPIAGGYSIDVLQPKNLEAVKQAQEKINELIASGSQDTNALAQAQERYNSLKLEQEKITLRISSADGEISVTEKHGFQNLALGAKSAAKELQNIESIMSQLHDVGALSLNGDGKISSSNQSIQNYLRSLADLQKYQDGLTPDKLFTPEADRDLSKMALIVQNYRKEVMALLKDTSKYNFGEYINTLPGGIDGLKQGEIIKSMQSVIAQSSDLAVTFSDKLVPITNEYGQTVSYQLAYALRTGKNEVQNMTAVLDPLTNELRVQKGEVQTVATGWEKFFAGLKGKMNSIIQYVISITSIHDMFRYISQGVQYVKEIDSALTELKKVTDASDASYGRFLQRMAQTGSVIGATVSDLTNMAADWARLGYSMEESAKLAESTAVLLNVSEFEDATSASEALISTMQAFQYTADESGHVVDILNEVGELLPVDNYIG